MHIKDHSAAMKFFRTYDSAASKGKWKEFVDEMEFDSMLQKPRTMAADGGRIGFKKGKQAVQLTTDMVIDIAEKNPDWTASNILEHFQKDKTKNYVTRQGSSINRGSVQKTLSSYFDIAAET